MAELSYDLACFMVATPPYFFYASDVSAFNSGDSRAKETPQATRKYSLQIRERIFA
jgi:hypothetical protein